MAQDVNLHNRQRAALRALLTEPTVARAAEVAGVSRATLHRYLGDPAFQAALLQEQRKVLESASARLVGLLDRALDAVSEDLESHDPKRRSKAYKVILARFASLREHADLEARVSALESALTEHAK